MRISCCLASSRENTITFRGVPSSPASTRRTNVFPMEPVPPVTRIVFPSNIIAKFRSQVCREFFYHLFPLRRRVGKFRAEASRVKAAVAFKLPLGYELNVEIELFAYQIQQIVL